MKRFLVFLMMFLPLLLHAQDKKWKIFPLIGVDMGGALPLPLSDIPDGSKGTPKLNPSLGLGIEYQLCPKWTLGLEVSYHILAFSASADVISQPFYFDNQTDILYFSGHTNTDVEFRFVEIPLNTLYSISNRWSLLAGAYYSGILKGYFETEGTDGILSPFKSDTDNPSLPGPANPKYNFNSNIDKWDAGILIGYRYMIIPRLVFWTSFQIGLNSIFKNDFENIRYEMYQFRLNAGIAFSLFE